MRNLWIVISTMAVANLLGLLGFAGWLAATDRLSGERVEQIRVMLAEPIAREQVRLATETAEVTPDQEQAGSEPGPTSLPTSERLFRQEEVDEIVRQRMNLLTEHVEALRRGLDRDRRQLDADRAAFQSERDEFLAYRRRVEEREQDAQFQKTVATLEGLKPADAHETLMRLLGAGQEEQVVAYLNALDERVRSKVLAEFVEADPEVAAGLLEGLRLYGVVAVGSEAPSP